jgi:hypothetical protein
MGETLKAYVTAEEIAVRAPGDYAALLGLEPPLASGVDGAFQAGSRWTLRSATVDFAAQGVAAGQLVRIRLATGPQPYPGELFVASSVTSDALVLRRPGEDTGVGQPPAPADGIQGVEFLVPDLMPRLARASREVAGRLGLLASGDLLSDVAGSGGPIRDLTVAEVLRATYDAAASLQAAGDPLAARAAAYRADYEERLARTAGAWDAAGCRPTRYGTRLSR